MPRPPFHLLLAVLSCACGHDPAPEVPRYPALPERPAAPQATAAEGVTPLSLSCGEKEVENGVDDDCNGHIDEGCGGTEGALELALSWQGARALVLGTEPALDAEPAITCTDTHVCVARLSTQTLPEGPLAVRVQAPAGEEDLTASLSVAARGKSLGAFNVKLHPGETTDVLTLR